MFVSDCQMEGILKNIIFNIFNPLLLKSHQNLQQVTFSKFVSAKLKSASLQTVHIEKSSLVSSEIIEGNFVFML